MIEKRERFGWFLAVLSLSTAVVALGVANINHTTSPKWRYYGEGWKACEEKRLVCEMDRKGCYMSALGRDWRAE